MSGFGNNAAMIEERRSPPPTLFQIQGTAADQWRSPLNDRSHGWRASRDLIICKVDLRTASVCAGHHVKRLPGFRSRRDVRVPTLVLVKGALNNRSFFGIVQGHQYGKSLILYNIGLMTGIHSTSSSDTCSTAGCSAC